MPEKVNVRTADGTQQMYIASTTAWVTGPDGQAILITAGLTRVPASHPLRTAMPHLFDTLALTVG